MNTFTPQPWLEGLQDADPKRVQATLQAWVQHPAASQPTAAVVWRTIEQLALSATPEVRAAARQALTSAAARAFYARWWARPPAWRQILRSEIAAWQQEGLITEEQAAVLLARYAEPPPRPSRPAAPPPRPTDAPSSRAERQQPPPRTATPRPAPASTRPAQWAPQLILALGALFTIAAALLFAALVASWRLPILAAATVIFAGAAAAVYRFMPTGGRVLGIVAAGFLWSVSRVGADLVGTTWGADARLWYWAAATWLLAGIWLAGGWLLRSALLTLAAWPMLAASVLYALSSLERAGVTTALTWTLAAWAAEWNLSLVWAWLIRERMPQATRWLWGLGHAVALFLLPLLLLTAALERSTLMAPAVWLPAALGYALLFAGYGLARRVVRPLPWLDTWAATLALAGGVLSLPLSADAAWLRGLIGLLLAVALAGLAQWRRASDHLPPPLGRDALAVLTFFWTGAITASAAAHPAEHWLTAGAWGLGFIWTQSVALQGNRWLPAISGWPLSGLATAYIVTKIWPAVPEPYWPGWLMVPLLLAVGLDGLGARLRKPAAAWSARGAQVLLAAFIFAGALGNWPWHGRDALILTGLTALGLGQALTRGWLVLAPLGGLIGLTAWAVGLHAWGRYNPWHLGWFPLVSTLLAWATPRGRWRRWARVWAWAAWAATWGALPFMVFDLENGASLVLVLAAALLVLTALRLPSRWLESMAALPGSLALAWAIFDRPHQRLDVLALTLLLALLIGYTQWRRLYALRSLIPPLVLTTLAIGLDAFHHYHSEWLLPWAVLSSLLAWGLHHRRMTTWARPWAWGALLTAWLTAGLLLVEHPAWDTLLLAVVAGLTAGYAALLRRSALDGVVLFPAVATLLLAFWPPQRSRDALAVLLLTVLTAGYARRKAAPALWGLVPPLGLAAWAVALLAWHSYHPAALAAWPVLAAVAGWLLRGRISPATARAWGWGSLAAAWVTAPLTLTYADGWSGLALAALATITAGQALLWRLLHLSLPAAGLYFWAYAWTLSALWDVRQPQLYTVPAALLGLLLHELYRRARHPTWALVIGTLSQLVLFTTTYGQMLAQHSGWYFAMLLLQGVVVLLYGLVIGAPALIWPPVGFVVLGTVSIVLIQFRDLGVLTLLCLAGLAFLAGGLYFLWRITRREDKTARPSTGPDAADKP